MLNFFTARFSGNVLVVLVLTFIVVLTGNWSSDILQGSVVFENTFLGPYLADSVLRFIVFASVVGIFFYSSFSLYRIAIKPLIAREVQLFESDEKRCAIVYFLSTSRNVIAKVSDDGVELSETLNPGNTHKLVKGGDLQKDIAHPFLTKWNGQQFMRMVADNKNIRHIYFIATNDSKSQYEILTKLLELYNLEKKPETTLYESVITATDPSDANRAVNIAIHRLMRDKGYSESQIAIDVTGGTKMMTAGAVLAAVGYRNVVMNYVNTEPPFNVVTKNIIMQSLPDRM